jgi:hypothetical protein
MSAQYAISNKSGPLAGASKTWRLIIGIHPKCPCTLATLSELERLMKDVQGVTSCSILVFIPADASAAWLDTTSVRRAKAIPGADVSFDVDGHTLKRLGFSTSGNVALCDASGTVRFQGGITASRGHEGINLGAESIRALADGRAPIVSETPVFGCRIVD